MAHQFRHLVPQLGRHFAAGVKAEDVYLVEALLDDEVRHHVGKVADLDRGRGRLAFAEPRRVGRHHDPVGAQHLHHVDERIARPRARVETNQRSLRAIRLGRMNAAIVQLPPPAIEEIPPHEVRRRRRRRDGLLAGAVGIDRIVLGGFVVEERAHDLRHLVGVGLEHAMPERLFG